MKKIALHWQILIGMALGVIFGIIIVNTGWGSTLIEEGRHANKNRAMAFVGDWIYPFGQIFISLLKMIAIPIIIVSLVKGVSDLKDISKFSKIGGRTIIIYIVTTVIAISIGLLLVNIIQPGSGISEATIQSLVEKSGTSASEKAISNAGKQASVGPLQALVDIVPSNVFSAFSDNGSMLKVIFFSILFGICLLLIEAEKAAPINRLFDGLYDVVLKMVDIIMLIAPYAVFALLANVVVNAPNSEVLSALGKYMGTVVLGLAIMVAIYCAVIFIYVKKNPLWFLNKISPAQLLAFSTSSSAATLPVTMERVTEHIGVDEEVSSFVLPVGATINMDGTSLYQAVAAVFISIALGHDLAFSDQLMIVLTALLASIGSAAVPGAGLIMLVIVLQSIDFPADKLAIGIALVLAVDRPLDMMRTVINVTGDATVSTVVAKSVGKLGEPSIQNWDDNFPLDKA